MKKIILICLVLLCMAFQCGPYEWNEPAVIVKNGTNREISLQFIGNSYFDDATHQWIKDTLKFNLSPEQTYCFNEGGLTDGYEDDPYTQEHLNLVFNCKIQGDFILAKNVSGEEEVLRVWSKNYDITSSVKEFFRLTDWRRKLNGGKQNNDAFVFKIEESDFIN